MSEPLVFVLGVIALVAIFQTALERRNMKEVHSDATECVEYAYGALASLSDITRNLHELSQIELRTAASMGAGPKPGGTHPSLEAARLRGYEVWRNDRIQPTQDRMRANYQRYESKTKQVIAFYNRFNK